VPNVWTGKIGRKITTASSVTLSQRNTFCLRCAQHGFSLGRLAPMIRVLSIILPLLVGGFGAARAMATCPTPATCVSSTGSCVVTGTDREGCEIDTVVRRGTAGGTVSVNIKNSAGSSIRGFSFTGENGQLEIDCTGCGGQAACIDAEGCENSAGNVFTCNYLVSCNSNQTECTWSQSNFDCDDFT